ncbi:MAG: hypothetical protein Q7S86_03840 [bacterium]|nr:hypothetical protein [bacterium]
MRLPKLLLDSWKSEDSVVRLANGRFDLIIAISYSTGREKLVKATEAIAHRAAELSKRYPQAKVVLSNCEYTFPGAEEVEWQFRRDLFAGYGITAHRAGNMNNSVQEAQAISRYVAGYKLPANRILIVTGEMHSRSARWIWERVMPNSEITVTCIGSEFEWQPDQPVFVQRGPWKWFAANIARQVLLQIFGLHRIARLHHRSEK